jgi:hypothetical protein
MSSKPEEPDFSNFAVQLNMSPLDLEAVHMYELFNSLQRAGFLERQALLLVAMIATETEDARVQYSLEDDDDEEDTEENEEAGDESDD